MRKRYSNYTLTTKIKNNITYVLWGRILSMLCSASSVILIARSFGDEMFGIFSYSLVFVGFIGLLPDFGMKPILIRDISKNRNDAPAIINNIITLKLILAIVAIVIGNFIGLILISENIIKISIFILSFTILLSAKFTTFRIAIEAIFYADMEMEYPIIFQLIDSFLQLLLVFLIIKISTSYIFVLIAYTFSNIPGFVLNIHFLSRKIKLRLTLQKDVILNLLKESYWIFLFLIVSMLFNRLDVMLLKHFDTINNVGLYSAAFRLTTPLNFIPIAFITVLYPIISRDDLLQKDEIFKIGIKAIAGIAAIIATTGLIFSDNMIEILYGDKYLDTIPSFVILMLSQIFIFIHYFIIDYNNSIQKQRFNLAGIIVSTILYAIFSVIVIPRYSIIGASFLKLVMSGVNVVFICFISRKYMKNYTFSLLLKSIIFITSCSLLFYILNIYTLNFLFKLVYIPFLLLFLYLIIDKSEIRLIYSKLLKV